MRRQRPLELRLASLRKRQLHRHLGLPIRQHRHADTAIMRVSDGFGNAQAEATALADLSKTLYKMKKSLNRAEIGVVAKRLESLGLNIPIPKGIDPSKMGKMRRG